MTIKDFFDERPELLEKLKKCNSEKEFSELAEKNGIKFGNNKLNDFYNFVFNKGQSSKEVSDNELDAVSGGQGNFSVSQINLGDKKINLIT